LRLAALASRVDVFVVLFGLGLSFAAAFPTDKGEFFVAIDAALGVEAFEDELGGGGALGIAFMDAEAELGGFLHEALDLVELADEVRGWGEFGKLEGSTHLEPLDDLFDVLAFEMSEVGERYGLADEVAGDVVAAFEFPFVFEFEFAGDGGEGGVDVEDAGNGGVVAGEEGAAFGIGDDVFED
jgi:hypothetical protein